jgi:hypothetical protein
VRTLIREGISGFGLIREGISGFGLIQEGISVLICEDTYPRRDSLMSLVEST